jgi:hypothetical protein
VLTVLRQEAATRQIPVILVSTSQHSRERAEAEHAIGDGDRSLLASFDLEMPLHIIQDLIGAA